MTSASAQRKWASPALQRPSYTQPALPETWVEHAVPKGETWLNLVSHSLLGLGSALFFTLSKGGWNQKTSYSPLLQMHVSFKPSKYVYRCEGLYRYIIAICRKQTWGYFCFVSLWKGKELSWSSCVGNHAHLITARSEQTCCPWEGGISGSRQEYLWLLYRCIDLQ